VKEAGAGYVQTVVQNNADHSYAAVGYSDWSSYYDILDWQDITLDVDALAADNADFDPTEVSALAFS
jgi:hypothetical protein